MGTLVFLGFLCTFLVTDALRCSHCEPFEYCRSANCSVGETVCRTIQNTNHLGVIELRTEPTFYRSCAAASACRPFSFTLTTLVKDIFGFTRALQMRVVSTCCDTDDCNEGLRIGGPPAGSIDNGLQCPNGGIAITNQGDKNLYTTCQGMENRCIALYGNKSSTGTMSLLGCATESACSLKANDQIIFDYYIFTLTEDAKCSSGNRLVTCCQSPAFLLSLVGIFLAKILS